MPVNLSEIKNRIDSAAATNRNALYDSHIYWSQKPYNICDILIQAFSQEGDTVFDPFLGSGVTLLEAINKQNKRKAVGCEINEAPLFIVRTLLGQYDLQLYKKAAEQFLEKLQELRPYYNTTCPHCGKTANLTSVLFDKPSRQARETLREVRYQCGCMGKCVKAPDEADVTAFHHREEIRYIKDEVLIPNTKLAVYENQHISQIFTPRAFTVLDRVLKIIDEIDTYPDLFRYILMSVLHLCKITDKHSNSQWPLWIPKEGCVEKNILDLLEKKTKKFEKTIRYLLEHYQLGTAEYKLLHKGSQHITQQDIADDSVQLVITDPPYLGQVAYSEYMQLYRPFLGLDFNLEDEIIVSSAPSREKNKQDYFKLLGDVFAVCSRKVKEGGYLCMYFHDCSLDVWNQLIAMLANCQFRYLSQAHVAKSNTLKNIISPKKSLNGDCILFFVKDTGMRQADGLESLPEIEENLVNQARQLIGQYGPLSTPALYDRGLMEVMIQNGWLGTMAKRYKSLVELFEQYLEWDPDQSRWK